MQNVADTANAAAEVAANASDAIANAATAAAPAAEALANTAAVEGAEAAATKFGLIEALNDGGALSWTLFLLMVVMSAVSWYILFTKLREQSKIREGRHRRRCAFLGCWQSQGWRYQVRQELGLSPAGR